MDSNLPISDSMVLVFAGVAMIFIALILLIICVSFLSKISKQTHTSGSVPANKPVFAGESAPFVEDGISDEVVAVIAAAISAFSSGSDGKSYAVRSVQKARNTRSVWATAGIQDNTRPF